MNIEKILSELTFEEKAALLTEGECLATTANARLGIEQINMSDGPYGVRRIKGVQKCNIDGGDTCFPTGSALGSAWNKEIAFSTGAAIADDCRQEGINMLLAPGVTMKRTPHCGRNFEYFSEDPYLSGMLGAAFINGVQSRGVGTSLKHYAANNQEIRRGTINAEVDERTLREYYLKVFEIVLRHSEPTSVMCAYNKLNGIWCSENRYLLTEILKDEWHYGGLVISDWGAVHDISKCLKAGLDLQMPKNEDIESQLRAGLDSGMITTEDIDRAVRSVLRLVDTVANLPQPADGYSRRRQHETAYDAACETVTLLRNENDILPITKQKYKKIAVLGRWAKEPLFMGGGSSKVSVDCKSVDIPLEYILKNADGIKVDYFPIFEDGFADEEVVHRIDALDKDYECAVLFVGDNYGPDCETESFDRDNLRLPNYINAVIQKTAEKYINTVAVIQSGSAVIPYMWQDVPAIVQMWYSGEAAGSAIADILFGKVNPSGKLSETFALKDRCGMDYPGNKLRVEYTEKQSVGYRYYDRHPEEIWFPFGHGLSYTEFEYGGLKISENEFNSEKFDVTVSFYVKNTGSMRGKEAVQLYVAPKDSVVARPVKELRNFDKVDLMPGETKDVSFTLTDEDFAYYNVCLHSGHIESGEYGILIGASSQDIRLSGTISISYDEDYTIKA